MSRRIWRHFRWIACASPVVLFFGDAPADRQGTFESAVLPMVKRYCVRCHSGDTPAGAVNLALSANTSQMLQQASDWRRVLQQLRAGTMPPSGIPAPTSEERKRAVDYLSSAILTAEKPLVTLRRLTKYEYKTTIRDLIGIEFERTDDFPNDDVGYGFDNIADVMSVSTLLVEKYLAAAEEIAKEAIAVPVAASKLYEGDALKATDGIPFAHDGARALFKAGSVFVTHRFPQPGNYALKLLAYADQAGPELAKMEIRLDGAKVGEFIVAATNEKPLTYETAVKVSEGSHRIEAAFVNDYYRPSDPNPKMRDRNLYLLSFEITQKDPVVSIIPDSHRRIVIASPPQSSPTDAARIIVTSFATKAFRRPPTSDEVERVMKVFAASQQRKEPFEQGIRNVVAAVLVSPQFLFRGQPIQNPAHKSYDIASRLSYFIWSSLPDDELMLCAKQGKLSNAEMLIAQVERMLKSPKSAALANNFGVQWLQLRKLETFVPDPKLFPAYSAELKTAMLEESKLFFQNVVHENRPIIDFLASDYTFLNGPLAKFYGFEMPKGQQFQKVSNLGEQRGGVISQASVLAITSNPNRTSPVKRGKWILEQILGDPTPPPPPGAGTLQEDKEFIAGQTMRQRLEQHRKNPECASCHARIDPLGFSLEQYDAIGGWRTQDDGAPLDTTGVLPDGTKLNGVAELKKVLLKRKDQFVRNFTSKLLIYALGRGLTDSDNAEVESIVKKVKANGYRFHSLVEAICLSKPFGAIGANR